MINYTLRCANGHQFTSWFQSAGAFDALKSGNHLSCPHCGTADVDKALMTPQVQTTSDTPATAQEPSEDERAKAIAAIRDHVEANSEYVGTSFAKEAREMHDGTSPHRAIWGEAAPSETKALLEDGVPVLPLPFRPTRKMN